ncbi:MAG: hypothetical protein D4R93_04765 [Deltaproteobacteria bacterium]|nr:MAG: hypothetical protein D4R93_04765 [Deltaproteobacteria bacterium]
MNAKIIYWEVFMKKKIQKGRSVAERFMQGEDPTVICTFVGKSRRRQHKWVARHTSDDAAWWERQPFSNPHRTPAEIEEIVEMVRLSLYNKGFSYGNQTIQWELENMEVRPIPSLCTISRILCRRDLTHRRTGRYESNGKTSPKS